MITIKQIRGTRNYFENYLSQNEYYSEGEKVVGRWRGKLAEMLGIEGDVVTNKHFAALAENKHPVTGEKLRPRSAQVKFHDLVISAPKSYSIAALVGKDERLIRGFHRAVEKTFKKLEQHIAVRDRAGGAYNTENFTTTGNGAAAVFLHDDNRLLDPQLHMHVVLSNHSFNAERGQYLALQPKMMMDESKQWITDYFHRQLAREAKAAGYEVELPGNRLRLTEVGKKLEYTFSKRAQHRREFEERYREMFGQSPDKKRIEQFIKDGKAAARQRFQNEYQAAFGKKPERKLVDDFAVDWRTMKKKDIGFADKHTYQRSQLTTTDARHLDELVARARVTEKQGQGSKADEAQSLEAGIVQQEQVTPAAEKWGAEEPRKELKPKVRRKKQTRQRIAHQKAIGRMEAIRRMKRGMAIAQALRGHPMVFMLQQISALTQNNHENNRRN